jgi:lysophospholipase L1-like esterase
MKRHWGGKWQWTLFTVFSWLSSTHGFVVVVPMPKNSPSTCAFLSSQTITETRTITRSEISRRNSIKRHRKSKTALKIAVAPSAPALGTLVQALQAFLWDSLFHTSTLLWVTVLVPVGIAVLQGSVAIYRFRQRYAMAPQPKIPCHGAVYVVNVNNHNTPTTQIPPKESIHCLVIGDSLAVGIGQSEVCTPVLPEEMAKEISKGTGKTVFWSCCGESGASTPWIIRMIMQSKDLVLPNNNKYTTLVSELKASSSFTSNNSTIGDDDWEQQIQKRHDLFDPHNIRPYDVVVLITGTNDLKNTFFPFLLDEQDRALREEIQRLGRDNKNNNSNRKEGRGVIQDVRLFMETFNSNMEHRLLMFRKQLEQQVEKTLQDIRKSAADLAEELGIDMDDQLDQIFGGAGREGTNGTNATTSWTEEIIRNQTQGFPDKPATPLFVLPGMPSRAVPILRQAPLSWFAIPVFDLMDRKKKKLAREESPMVSFVRGPGLHEIIEYEHGMGRIWNEQQNERVILSLKDIRKEECQSIQDSMKRFYHGQHKHSQGVEAAGVPGLSVFSVDGIHPRETGYTIWGKLGCIFMMIYTALLSS